MQKWEDIYRVINEEEKKERRESTFSLPPSLPSLIERREHKSSTQPAFFQPDRPASDSILISSSSPPVDELFRLSWLFLRPLGCERRVYNKSHVPARFIRDARK